MARTFDQSEVDEEDRKYSKGVSRSPGRLHPEDLRDQAFEDILQPDPPDLVADELSGRNERREEVARQLRLSLNDRLTGELGADLDDISVTIEDLLDQDLSDLSELELLGVIAEGVRTIAALSNVRVEQGISSLAIFGDIATAVEPAASITTSGTNTTNDGGEPTPVIPNADDQDVATRNLMIRASTQNSEPIYFGDDGVEPSSGFMLKPGEWKQMNINFLDTVLYMASDNGGQEVQLLGVI